jgi:probable rRNA maturation factor
MDQFESTAIYLISGACMIGEILMDDLRIASHKPTCTKPPRSGFVQVVLFGNFALGPLRRLTLGSYFAFTYHRDRLVDRFACLLTMILFDPEQSEAVEGFPRLASEEVKLPGKPTLMRYLRDAQAAVGLRGEVSVLLTTDDGIRGLNRRFRKKNKATDVLSFPVEAGFGVAGDLAISVETAARQAREQGHRLSVELRVLMLHGLLHLAGMDHETDDGKMARKERRLRAKLGLPLGLIERNESDQWSVVSGRVVDGGEERVGKSRFPAGMTERKAKARTNAKAGTKTKAEVKIKIGAGKAATGTRQGLAQ